VSHLKPTLRRPKASEDVEGHATYIADGNIDTALKFLERVEHTIKGLSLFTASGAPFPSRRPELAGVRTKLVKDFPNHVVFDGAAPSAHGSQSEISNLKFQISPPPPLPKSTEPKQTYTGLGDRSRLVRPVR
jgi:toxin ParE1/3/4